MFLVGDRRDNKGSTTTPSAAAARIASGTAADKARRTGRDHRRAMRSPRRPTASTTRLLRSNSALNVNSHIAPPPLTIMTKSSASESRSRGLTKALLTAYASATAQKVNVGAVSSAQCAKLQYLQGDSFNTNSFDCQCAETNCAVSAFINVRG